MERNGRKEISNWLTKAALAVKCALSYGSTLCSEYEIRTANLHAWNVVKTQFK